MIAILKSIFRCITCKYNRKTPEIDQTEGLLKQLGKQKANDFNYWRTLADEYSKKQVNKEKEKDAAVRQMDR